MVLKCVARTWQNCSTRYWLYHSPRNISWKVNNGTVILGGQLCYNRKSRPPGDHTG